MSSSVALIDSGVWAVNVPKARLGVKMLGVGEAWGTGSSILQLPLLHSTQEMAREEKLHFKRFLLCRVLFPFPTPISLVHFLLIGPDWKSS
jgi:hypothetical protein